MFWYAGVIACCLALPLFISKGWISLIIEVMILALGSAALNLLFGYGGMINFGHAGPYATGAYAAAILIAKLGVPFWIAMFASPFITALLFLGVGLLCIRLVDIYFAFLTLAFSLLIWTVVYTWYGFTGGEDGLSGIPVPRLIFSLPHYYYFCLAVVVGCLILLKRIGSSPFGRVLQAARENPVRIESVGVNLRLYKLLAFVISSFFAGVAGALFVGFSHAVYPTYAGVMKSTIFMLICILGGMYNFTGPIVGAVAYMFLEKTITSQTEYWSLVLGLVLVLLVLFLRGGIVGYIDKLWRGWGLRIGSRPNK
jgi:branched-chain amino acid transport system permease protein